MTEHDNTHVVRLSARGNARGATVLGSRSAVRSARIVSQHEHELRGAELRRSIKAQLAERERHVVSSISAMTIATGMLGKAASILLIPMIFLQPLLPLYAADETIAPPPDAPVADVVSPPPETPPTEVTEPPPAESPSGDTASPSDTPVPTTDVETPPVESPPAETPPDTGTSPSDTVASSTESVPSTPDTATSTDPTPADSTGTSTEVVPPPPPEGGNGGGGGSGSVDTSTSTPNDNEDPSSSQDEATSTPVTVDENPPALESTTSEEIMPQAQEEDPAIAQAAKEAQEARMRAELKKEVEAEFLKGCISYERSGYYCLNDDARKAGADAPVNRTIVSVEEGQDSGGDKEIYVVKGDTRVQMTQNDYDDAFPAQDISGEHVSWQGMKNGRWQIFYADNTGTGTPEILQVTDSKESNFNPKVDGDHVVWQGWVDENWEIFLAARRLDASPFASEHLPPGNKLMNVGAEWEVDRLTENKEHDMFPSLHGDIVTWQAHEGDNWVVYAYSMSQKTKTKLSSDGAKSEHPRFAITWEERDKEGGARLMSYDMATGEKVDLTQESEQLPKDPFRDAPKTPISQNDQAALPGVTNGTSTPQRGEDDTGGGNGLTP